MLGSLRFKAPGLAAKVHTFTGPTCLLRYVTGSRTSCHQTSAESSDNSGCFLCMWSHEVCVYVYAQGHAMNARYFRIPCACGTPRKISKEPYGGKPHGRLTNAMGPVPLKLGKPIPSLREAAARSLGSPSCEKVRL